MSAANIQVIKDAYAAFGRGDMPAILERVSDRGFERWGVVAGGARKAPWHVMLTSKGEVASYFEKLLGAVEPVKFEPQHFAADGAWVYVTLSHEYRVRNNGKTLSLPDSVIRFEFVDGRIVAALVSEDTERVTEALGL